MTLLTFLLQRWRFYVCKGIGFKEKQSKNDEIEEKNKEKEGNTDKNIKENIKKTGKKEGKTDENIKENIKANTKKQRRRDEK